MDGVGPVTFEGFRLGGTCVCVLVSGPASYLSEGHCHVQ